MAHRPGLTTPAWPRIDWREPWFEPWRGWGEPALRGIGQGRAVCDALNAVVSPHAAVPRFVSAEALPDAMPYEAFVHASATVPTRENLHDFFNGIVWCGYPNTKRLLNRLQASAIERDGVGGRRGPLRDAITLFDENGAVFSAPEVLQTALRTRDWQGLFITHREAWRDARLWLFGHALVEKLVAPRKDITAHVLCAPEGQLALPQVDDWLAATHGETTLARKPFAPLPVLGVPGWWPANAEAGFYEDPTVFRPVRT